jgi:hypothetical protein
MSVCHIILLFVIENQTTGCLSERVFLFVYHCKKAKDAGFVYKSFRNKSSNLGFLLSQNESTKQIHKTNLSKKV